MGSGEESFCGETTDFTEIKNVRKEARRISDGREEFQGNIQDAVVSNIMEITETEEEYLRALLETPVLQRIEIKNRRLSTKSVLEGKEMPEAEGIYSDGSRREIPADWDKEELETFAHKGPGEYEIHGKLRKKHYRCLLQKERRSFYHMLSRKVSDDLVRRKRGHDSGGGYPGRTS